MTDTDLTQKADPKSLRTQLVETAARKPIRLFRQFDCFIGAPNDRRDSVIQFDAAGHSVFGGTTQELRNEGPGMVRLTIHHSVGWAEAVLAVRKLAARIEGGFWEATADPWADIQATGTPWDDDPL